jgi:predicted dehydrogenase
VELEHLYGYDDSHWRFTPAPGQEHLTDLWADGPAVIPSGHPAQYAHIIEAISSGAVPPVTLAEAYPTMELAAAIYASALTGKTVRRGDIHEGHPFFDRADGRLEPWKLEKSNA